MGKREATEIYVYCITEGEPIKTVVGLHPYFPVSSISDRGLVAAISPVPSSEFSEKALTANLADLKWLERQAQAHECVIEKIMESRPVLPMKLCTIFLTPGKVVSLLHARREEFLGALRRIRGKEEWQVKLYLSAPSPSDWERDDPEENLSGTEYLLKKSKEQQGVAAAPESVRREARRSLEALSGLVEEMQLKPIGKQRSSAGRPTLVWDVVCLLVKSRARELCKHVDLMSEELVEAGFHFQVSGPWPPYHFAQETQDSVHISYSSR